MKTIRLSLLILTLAIGSNIYAQKQTVDPESYSAKITDWMKSNLQLTEQQIPQVQAINLKYANKLKDLQNSSGEKQQKMKALVVNEEAKDSELKNVFTAEQFKTYLSKKEEMKKLVREKMQEKRNGG